MISKIHAVAVVGNLAEAVEVENVVLTETEEIGKDGSLNN
jgi:hypothetical protein